MEGTSVLKAVTGVFSGIGDWIVETLPKMVPIFYSAESGLTFFGTLAVAGLAVSIFFLLLGLVQNFLHFRG